VGEDQENLPAGAIEFEVRRELNQDGAEMVAVVENAGDFHETFQSALAVAEPLNVGDLLVGLKAKRKPSGTLLAQFRSAVSVGIR